MQSPPVSLITLPDSDPASVLAWEEALLDASDIDSGTPMIWFWESPTWWVVVGYGQRVGREVDEAACRREGVPVYRRCTGGGTVLQGPGCLNYGVVLPWDADGPLATIASTNAWVMQRQCVAVAPLLTGEVSVRGHTDLAWNGRKISGNAQRRRRSALLFHGSFLCDLDLDRMERYLRMPSAVPDYREGRTHRSFVVNTGLDPARIREALLMAWGAKPAAEALPFDRWRILRDGPYSDPAWHAGR